MKGFEDVVDEYHRATKAFIRGEPATLRLYSHGRDVTLANPLGPPARGWDGVRELVERAASQIRDGEGFTAERISECVTKELAYIVEIERCTAKLGGAGESVPIALRVTTIFRREDGSWKIVHRHADPITGQRPIESIAQS